MKGSTKSYRSKILAMIILIFASSFLCLNTQALEGMSVAQASGSFSYQFAVSQEGLTIVRIIYRSSSASGSSWVLVPKFSEWTNRTIRGNVKTWSLVDTENLTGVQLYFYEALLFSFTSDGTEFQMEVNFNFSTAAMIIEPNGIFYSPQIGFEKGNTIRSEVIFPSGFVTNQGEAIASGIRSYTPSSALSNSNYVLFNSIPSTDNMIRIEIGFRTANKTQDLLTIREGLFSFQTVRRYESYARGIMNLYNRTYSVLAQLFNRSLESAKVQFFLPDFNSLLSIGGYVPFSGKEMGDIYINIVFTRYVTGYIEVIALHEIVHHFLWKADISPETLLWFHEGMAQYISLEEASRLNYEGASMMKQEIEDDVTQLRNSVGDDLAFLKEWTPSQQPATVGLLYTGAYYVVSRVAEPYEGLDYYVRFFELKNGVKINDNAMLAYYMSLAANESIVPKLNSWNFAVQDLYTHSTLIDIAEKALNEINPIYQPYKFLAEWLYRQALSNAGKNGPAGIKTYLTAVILIAKLAPLLTLITFSGILFGIILLVLRKEGVFSNYSEPNPR